MDTRTYKYGDKYSVPIVGLKMVCENRVTYKESPELNMYSDVIRIVKDLCPIFFEGSAHEKLVAITTNIKNKVMCLQVFNGSVNNVTVDPAAIAKVALLSNASGVVLVHNHPSGSLRPSPSDWELTQKVKTGLQLFGIVLEDHVLVDSWGIEIKSMRLMPRWVS